MIKKLCLLLVFLSFTLHGEGKANSTLIIHQDFNVISVNGKSYNNGFLSSESKVKLRPGVNKIAIEYEVVFDQEDEFDLIKSDTLLVSFYANKDKSYILNYLKPANSRAARAFAKNPIFNIFDQTGEQLRASSVFLGSDSEGFVNQQTRPSLSGQPPIRITSGKKAKVSKNDSSKSAKPTSNAEERLEYWWRKATPEQRQSFLDKVLNNK